MRAAVITAIYDNYDSLKPICEQIGFDVEWIVVTDNKNMQSDEWTVIYEPRPGMHPNRAAKKPKMLPWRYTEAEASVWIDASYRVISPQFVQKVVELADPIAQFVHPWRSCAYDEAEESVKLAKYNGEPCATQLEAYEMHGFPRKFGLWATGVIARHHTPAVKDFGATWYSHVLNWSFQDQLSHPYALWRNELRPQSLPGTHLANPWLKFEGSGRH